MTSLGLLYAIQGEVLGGAELHAIDLARRLALRGHRVFATCRPGSSRIHEALLAESPPLHGVHPVESYLEMAVLIDHLRPQLIQHFNSLVPPAAVEIARHRPCSVQVVHANHALDPSHRAIPTHSTDVLVAVSESAAAYHPAPRGRDLPLRVVSNGIDTAHFVPPSRLPASPPLRLLSVGRLDEAAKRTNALVAACAGLRDCAWRLTLVGDGPARAAIEGTIRERGLCGVELVGQRDDPVIYYQSAHVYLSYSESEAFGRSLAEAAACGLAILARRCRGVTDLFEDGTHALLASSDAEFARALQRLAADAALRSRLGRAARELAVRRLDVGPMVDAYESLYRDLVAMPPAARGDGRRRSARASAAW